MVQQRCGRESEGDEIRKSEYNDEKRLLVPVDL